MNSIKNIFNNIKMPNLKRFNLSIDGSGFLYNKALLYFIFAISFGNFMLEMIAGNSYFIIVYLLIGFLTTFFNKNMIVVLLMSTIFANILKYGAQSVEGFDGEDDGGENYDGENDDGENDDGENDGQYDESSNYLTNHKKKDVKNKKEDTKESYTDRELDNIKYKESEKMIENQNLLLKNMKDFKPFLDTIQGITKSFSKSPSTEKE